MIPAEAQSLLSAKWTRGHSSPLNYVQNEQRLLPRAAATPFYGCSLQWHGEVSWMGRSKEKYLPAIYSETNNIFVCESLFRADGLAGLDFGIFAAFS